MADYSEFMEYDYGVMEHENSSSNRSTNYTNLNYSYSSQLLYDGLSHLYYHKIFSFEVPILGYMLPSIIFLMLLTNTFIVVIFSRNYRKTSTTILFLSIAVSDTLAGLALVPGFIFVYQRHVELLSLRMCHTVFMLRLYLFPVFHTVSIWQTLTLGFQRYMCVYRPFFFRTRCTNKRTLIAIIVFYVMALSIHSFHLVKEKTYKDTTISLCAWIIETPCTSSCYYMWITLLLIHILPCLLLTFFTAMTIFTMYKSAMTIENINCDKEGVKRRWSRDRHINIMVVFIAIAFLIPEFSNGIYYLVFVVNKHMSGNILPHEVSRLVTAIYMVLLVVSFNINFLLYCCMMKDFRRTVSRFFTFFHVRRRIQSMYSLSRRLSSMQPSCVSTSTSATCPQNLQVTIHNDDVFLPSDELCASSSNQIHGTDQF